MLILTIIRVDVDDESMVKRQNKPNSNNGGNPGVRLARIDVDIGIEECPRINPTANSLALMKERIKMDILPTELKNSWLTDEYLFSYEP